MRVAAAVADEEEDEAAPPPPPAAVAPPSLAMQRPEWTSLMFTVPVRVAGSSSVAGVVSWQ